MSKHSSTYIRESDLRRYRIFDDHLLRGVSCLERLDYKRRIELARRLIGGIRAEAKSRGNLGIHGRCETIDRELDILESDVSAEVVAELQR